MLISSDSIRRLRGVSLSVTLLLGLAGLAGCDVVSSKEATARDLYKRVALGDCLAYDGLESHSLGGDQHASAYLGLAIQQRLGQDCRSSLHMALRAYQPAIGKSEEVDFNVALIYLALKNYTQAEVALLRSAGGEKRDGLRRAMVKLAQMYNDGLAGFPNSESLAAQWMELAANKGDMFALTQLGLRTIDGRGVQRDFSRGVQMLEHAAQKGSRDARLALFDLNVAGRIGSLGPQREQAAKWLGAAAAIDAGLQPKYNAYLRTLPADAQQAVLREVGFFTRSMREKWVDEPYDQPVAPASLDAS